LAEARGADVSAEGMEMYAKALSVYPDEDTRAVLDRCARSERAEGEKAWPALATLTGPLDRMQERRREQAKQQRERQEHVELFWKIAAERLEMHGAFNFNGVAYSSLDELNQAPTGYKGTKPR